MSIRLVQLLHSSKGRRIALVDGETLRFLPYASVYDFAVEALSRQTTIPALLRESEHKDGAGYEAIYAGTSDWRLLPAFDHPDEPARCLVSGTGLTHRKSAENRQAMHAGTAQVTDSMRMYEWGVAGGRPAAGEIGAPPEWFYKGNGTIVRAHGDALPVPPYAGDGGEEPELAGAYIIGREGRPYRVGIMQGNEFSDHKTEKKNYLYLAPSKLRNCSVGPEIVVDAEFSAPRGRVRILRAGREFWSKAIGSGEENMCHSLANIEHHHFKFDEHRRPGDAHIHFFGADAFSFGEGIELLDGDLMEVSFEGFGRPLVNPVRIDASRPSLISVKPLA